jgi:transcription initiation factor TFIIB
MTSIYENFADIDLTKYFEDIDFSNINTIQTPKIEAKQNFKCTTCDNTELIINTNEGIIVCEKCGQVLDNVLDYSPEWKQYEDDDKTHGRCGLPINKLLPQSSLGTNIVGIGFNRLKTLHRWNSMPYKERSLNNVFKSISEKCNKNSILKCIEDDAKIMYKTISECKHVKGKNKGKFIITRGINRVSIIAACVFFACRRKGMTRTPKEIADIFNIKHMEMNRGCKNFLKLLKIKKFNMNMGTSNAEHFIRRYCNKLKIKTHYTEKAINIAKNIEKLNIASVHTPYSLAAASILIMADFNNLHSITKKKLAFQFEISEVTITKTFKKLEQYKDIINNDTMTCNIVKNINKQSENIIVSQAVLDRMAKFGINISKFIEDNKINNSIHISNSSNNSNTDNNNSNNDSSNTDNNSSSNTDNNSSNNYVDNQDLQDNNNNHNNQDLQDEFDDEDIEFEDDALEALEASEALEALEATNSDTDQKIKINLLNTIYESEYIDIQNLKINDTLLQLNKYHNLFKKNKKIEQKKQKKQIKQILNIK